MDRDGCSLWGYQRRGVFSLAFSRAFSHRATRNLTGRVAAVHKSDLPSSYARKESKPSRVFLIARLLGDQTGS
jgi:hypothetical protein